MPEDNQSPTGVPMDDLALELADAGVTGTSNEGDTTDSQSAAPTIPAKYQGKSVEDLISMHQNAERRLSQQGQELGEVRRLADQLIGVKVQDNTKRPERKPVTVDALLADPEQVLTNTLESSTVAQRQAAQDQRLQQLELSVQQKDFVGKYPDFQSDMNNPQFHEWIQKNRLRTELAQRAYKNDYNAADSLWSLWEESKGSNPTNTQQQKQNDRSKTLQNAKTQKGGSAEDAPAKTYSRAKLMELRAKVADGDPAAVARWNDEEFQAKLIEAYSKGLVK